MSQIFFNNFNVSIEELHQKVLDFDKEKYKISLDQEERRKFCKQLEVEMKTRLLYSQRRKPQLGGKAKGG